jgi:hypothetical protein
MREAHASASDGRTSGEAKTSRDALEELKTALGGLFTEAGEEAEEPGTEPAQAGYSAGIVPPPGPMPRRFGPPWYVVWLNRVVALAVPLYVFLNWLRVPLRQSDAPLGTIVVLLVLLMAVLLALRTWQRYRQEITALAVIFEPYGITVRTALGSRQLAWGDLVGLETPRGGKGWALRAQVGSRPLLVRFPAKQSWTRELVDLLRGVPEAESRFAAGSPRS